MIYSKPFPLLYGKGIFFSVSHQTELNTRSTIRRSIIVGIRGGEGRARAEARVLLVYAGHRPTKCYVGQMSLVGHEPQSVLKRMKQKITIGKCGQKELLVFFGQLNWYILHTFHNKNGFHIHWVVIYPATYTRANFISLERDGLKFSRLSNISEPSSQSL